MTYNPSPTDWAYAAGLFDGEGSLRAKPNNNKPQYHVSFTLAQRDVTPLLWLEETIGGRVNLNNPRKTYWVCSARDEVQRILTGMRPYLIVKEDQVVAALQLLQLPRPIRGPEADALAYTIRIAKREQYA